MPKRQREKGVLTDVQFETFMLHGVETSRYWRCVGDFGFCKVYRNSIITRPSIHRCFEI